MSVDKSPEVLAQEFLDQARLYKLGQLPTESSHPLTKNLSQLAQGDVAQAVALLTLIDRQALTRLQSYVPQLAPLAKTINETKQAGGRIFICGCGATGRLALSLEYLWRLSYPKDVDRVVSFMAGGDVALVHSIEGFEDFPEYGAEQLQQLGFSEGDLLISSTEGGETPFVIGATEAALKISNRAPFFLYCNPREILVEQVERSRRVLTNPMINSICLFVGPMALAGSTRMQASTVLQLAIGLALFSWTSSTEVALALGRFIDFYVDLDKTALAAFIQREAEIYKNKNYLMYTAEDLAITVFTDTTERSPTFSLPPFNNQELPRPQHSLAYVMIPSANTPVLSWQKLLARPPRLLNWHERNIKTTGEYWRGFDFSQQALAYRQKVLPGVRHEVFSVLRQGESIVWRLQDQEWMIGLPNMGILFDHILLKMLLNIHSTLVMGRRERYVSNFMTFVNPTNGKLIDRACRYVKWLFSQSGRAAPNDEVVVLELFKQLHSLGDNESVVLKTFSALGGKIK